LRGILPSGILDYRILGPLEVCDGDEPIYVGPRQQRALLAILLVHANRIVATERILEDLWPDDPFGKALVVPSGSPAGGIPGRRGRVMRLLLAAVALCAVVGLAPRRMPTFIRVTHRGRRSR
jgi:hypothetical protein